MPPPSQPLPAAVLRPRGAAQNDPRPMGAGWAGQDKEDLPGWWVASPRGSAGLSLPHTVGQGGLGCWPRWVTAGVEEEDAEAGWR